MNIIKNIIRLFRTYFLIIFISVLLPNVSTASIVKGKVVSIEGNNIELSVGSSHGVQQGDYGRVYYIIKVGENQKAMSVNVAKIKITYTSTKTAMAKIEQKTAEVQKGYLVEVNVKGLKKKSGIRRSFTNSIGMKFVYIKPGTFMMGSPSNEPGRDDDETQHKVTLTKGFYMQTTEVTVGQWRSFIRDTAYKTDAEGNEGKIIIRIDSKYEVVSGHYWDNPGFSQTENSPVTCISWHDVQAFIKWLNRKDGRAYRLPTEAEWEYAARAGTNTPFHFGRCLSTNKANYNGNYTLPGCLKGKYREKTVTVDSFSPNAWGLYNMHGNVFEYCEDEARLNNNMVVTDTYRDEIVDPLSKSGNRRVVRGFGWWDPEDKCRSASRGSVFPRYPYAEGGFRLCANR